MENIFLTTSNNEDMEIYNYTKKETIEGLIKDLELDLPNNSEISVYIAYLKNLLNILFPNAKKKNIVSGNFSMKGRFDLEPASNLVLEIWRKFFTISIGQTGSIDKQILNILYQFGIKDADLIYLDTFVDIHTDTLDIDFCFQTDEAEDKWLVSDIKIAEAGRSYTGGYCNWNKFLLNGNRPAFNKFEIYDYPLISFSAPYNLSLEDCNKILEKVTKNPIKNGILADMRALGKSNLVKDAVEIFKGKNWLRIFTLEKKYVLRNGNYIAY